MCLAHEDIAALPGFERSHTFESGSTRRYCHGTGSPQSFGARCGILQREWMALWVVRRASFWEIVTKRSSAD